MQPEWMDLFCIIVCFSYCSIFCICCCFLIVSHQPFIATSKVCTCKLIAQSFVFLIKLKIYLFWKHCLCSLPYFTAQKSFCLLKYNNAYSMLICVMFSCSPDENLCYGFTAHIIPSDSKDKRYFAFLFLHTAAVHSLSLLIPRNLSGQCISANLKLQSSDLDAECRL